GRTPATALAGRRPRVVKRSVTHFALGRGASSRTERCSRRSGALPALMRDLRPSAPPRKAADRATEGAFTVHYGAATVGTSHTVGPLNQTYPCHRLTSVRPA